MQSPVREGVLMLLLFRLKDDVDCVFRRRSEPFVEPGALSRIHAAVRELLDSNAGPFIFDYFRVSVSLTRSRIVNHDWH